MFDQSNKDAQDVAPNPKVDSMKDDAAQLPSEVSIEKGIRIKISAQDLTFEAVKSIIYTQVQQLHEQGHLPTYLHLSSDIYEILNKRLVFKTAAHKEYPHLITPFGNLLVTQMTAELDQPQSFIIE